MSSTNTDQMILQTGRSDEVWAVAFHTNRKHVLDGNNDGFQRWRLADGQEVGRQTGMAILAISVSRDHKWIVCGTYRNGASVWNGEMDENVINVEDETTVDAVDVSPDSTTFATGTRTKEASIWSITTGQRLVGPLKHDQDVNGIRYSPNGDRIATACYMNIRILDSHSGEELVTINTDLSLYGAITPIAWSNDGQKLFAVSSIDEIRAFDASTGAQRAKSQIPRDSNNTRSIAIATNSKFIATFADDSIWLLDTSTLARIGPVIEDDKPIRSVAISPDSSRLATGRHDGKIVIRDLGKILPDLYGPFNVSTRDEVQQDEQPSTSGDHDGKASSSTPEDPGKSGPPESGGHSGDNDDLLEVEVSSSMPIQFDYDESLSAVSSVDVREDEIPLGPVGSSHPISISQPSDILPVTSLESRAEENLDTVESPRRGHSIFRKWLQRKSNRGPTPPKPGRPSGKSRQPTDRRSPSHSSPRVDATKKGPSWMAAGQRRPRTVATSWQEDKSPAKTTVPKHPKKDASRSGQGSASANEAGPAQQVNNSSQPSTGRVHVLGGSGDAIIALRVPSWMVCGSSGTQDGTHGSR